MPGLAGRMIPDRVGRRNIITITDNVDWIKEPDLKARS